MQPKTKVRCECRRCGKQCWLTVLWPVDPEAVARAALGEMDCLPNRWNAGHSDFVPPLERFVRLVRVMTPQAYAREQRTMRIRKLRHRHQRLLRQLLETEDLLSQLEGNGRVFEAPTRRRRVQ